MKYAYYGFGMLLFGSIGLVLIVMLQSVTINNDSEYYDLKEAMKAAMLESVDVTCYAIDPRINNDSCGAGKLKISEQKFVENFTRRFVAAVGGDASSYELKFYDIIESPPKASVVVEGVTNNYGIVSDNRKLTITNSLTGILEQDKVLVLKGREYTIVDIDEINKNFTDLDVDENNIVYPETRQEVVYGDDLLSVSENNYSSDKWEVEPADSGCNDSGCLDDLSDDSIEE